MNNTNDNYIVLIGSNPFCKDWTNKIQQNEQTKIVSFAQLTISSISIISSIDDLQPLQKQKQENKRIYILPLSITDYECVQPLVPLRKVEAKPISNNPCSLHMLHPTTDIFHLLHNKVTFTQFMMTHFNHLIPKVYYINNMFVCKDIQFPVLLKPMFSTNGRNMKIVHKGSALKSALNQIKKNHIVQGTTFVQGTTLVQGTKGTTIVQEFIQDLYEYSAYFVCLEGHILTQKIIRMMYPRFTIKTRNFPKQYETVIDCETINNLLCLFCPIITHLHYSGGMCIDFKWAENRLSIFEINPRFGGSAFEHSFFNDLIQFHKNR